MSPCFLLFYVIAGTLLSYSYWDFAEKEGSAVEVKVPAALMVFVFWWVILLAILAMKVSNVFTRK